MIAVRRCAFVFVIILSLLLPTCLAHAQDTCLSGLSAGDCDLLTEATNNLSKLSTSVMEIDFSMQIGGLSTGAVSVAFKGNGPINFSKLDGTTLSAVLQQVAMANTAKLSIMGNGQSRQMNLNLQVLDGVLYFKPTQVKQWFKVELDKVATAGAGNVDMSAVLKLLDPETIKLADAFGTSGMVTATSAAGPAVDGKPTTQITVNLNIATAYTTVTDSAQRKKMLQDFLRAAVRGSGQGDANVNLNDPALLASAERALKSFKLSLVWIVGRTDKLMHGFGLNMAFQSDTALTAILATSLGRVNLTFNLKSLFTFSKVGQAVKIGPAPDNAHDVMPSSFSGAPL